MKIFKLVLLSLLTLNVLTCFAVKIDEPAPELQIGSWIKNGPSTLAEGKGKKIYIIEFWATSCQPCLKVMPYFQRLQNEYKDQLTIISISTEKTDKVKSFIDKCKGINYKIAVDDKQKTYNSYMQGNMTIPTAFIINKSGTVAWIGHPLDIYLPLKRIITGKFNIKESARCQKVYREIQILLSRKKAGKALELVNSELKKVPDNVQFIALKTFILFNLSKKDEALKFITAIFQTHPADMEIFKLKAHVLIQMKKFKELDELYLTFIDNCKDAPLTLNQLARQLLGVKFGEAKLKPALKAAELAYSNRKLYPLQRAEIGETLARIYYMTGRIDRAIKIQNIVCRILKNNKSERYPYTMAILQYYVQAYNLGK